MEAAEREKEIADQIVRNTKSFKGRYGFWGFRNLNWSGTLIVAPTKVQFVWDDTVEYGNRRPPEDLGCSVVDIATTDGAFIREIRWIYKGKEEGKTRFQAESPAEAADAFAAIRAVCKAPESLQKRK